MRLLSTILILLLAGPAWSSECVVLLHGLLRSADSMKPMEDALREAGFETANVEYPSRDAPIEELAAPAVEEGILRCRAIDGVDTIHFVTHSLGGILVRYYLEYWDITGLGRVVMLGPPNQGSLAADRMGVLPGYDLVQGPVGRQLGKGENSVPLQLGPADFELGIIAGNETIDPITSAVLPNPDDGKVSVEDTKLEGMDDFVVVDHSHTFMMRLEEPIELTIRFLKTGRFSED
jgi:pimeloyl-ACP methyl ester carboxylesterase